MKAKKSAYAKFGFDKQNQHSSDVISFGGPRFPWRPPVWFATGQS